MPSSDRLLFSMIYEMLLIIKNRLYVLSFAARRETPPPIRHGLVQTVQVVGWNADAGFCRIPCITASVR